MRNGIERRGASRVTAAVAAACALVAGALALPAVAGAEPAGAGSFLISPAGGTQRVGPAPVEVAGGGRSRSGDRVVGGGTTTAGDHPWQAELVFDGGRFAGSDFSRAFCGGSLVTPLIVLTAAHCVIDTDPDDDSQLDADDVDVIVGRTTLSGTGGTEHNVFATYVPVIYNHAAKQNDYAYISLVTASAQPRIDIVDRNDGQAWKAGAPTRVSGYGATSEGGSASDTLKVATVPIIPDDTCGSPLAYSTFFARSVMICAGFMAGVTDACQGDSGGPLQTASGPPLTRLVGLVSFGAGCARANAPGVYTRVAQNPVCAAQVANVASIEASELIPASEQEPVVGPAGCSDSQVAAPKKCKKKKRKKPAAAAKKCKKKRKKKK